MSKKIRSLFFLSVIAVCFTMCNNAEKTNIAETTTPQVNTKGTPATQTNVLKSEDAKMKEQQEEKVVAVPKIEKSSNIKLGKYYCTASKYVNGFYEYQPRGYFTLSSGGKYSYTGFEQPSNGTFAVDDKGNLSFAGGYLDAGAGEKTEKPNQFLVVFPANPDNRWTCTCKE